MKNILLGLCLLLSHFIFAQTHTAKDTLVWNDGTIYTGTFIQKDIRNGQVKFMTDDSVMHIVSSASIAQIKTARPIAGQVPAKAITTDTIPHSRMGYSSSTYEDHIDWCDPEIPHRALVKHRTGLGLGITGGTLFVAGAVMLIGGLATNGQTTTTSTSANVNVGAIGGIGLLSIIVGLPMMITGIVKFNKAAKLARAGRIVLH